MNTGPAKWFDINGIVEVLVRCAGGLLKGWLSRPVEYVTDEWQCERLVFRTHDGAEVLVSEMRTLMGWLRYGSSSEWPRADSRDEKGGLVSVQLKKDQMIVIARLPDGKPFPGRIVDIAEKTLRLISARELSPGTCVRVVCQGILLLGEVSFCQRSDRDVRLKVIVKHALFGAPEIADSCRRLLKATAETKGRFH